MLLIFYIVMGITNREFKMEGMQQERECIACSNKLCMFKELLIAQLLCFHMYKYADKSF